MGLVPELVGPCAGYQIITKKKRKELERQVSLWFQFFPKIIMQKAAKQRPESDDKNPDKLTLNLGFSYTNFRANNM